MEIDLSFIQRLSSTLSFTPDKTPNIITNMDSINIYQTFQTYLFDNDLSIVFIACPYITIPFINLLEKTKAQLIFMIIDSERNVADNTLKSAKKLLELEKQGRFQVIIIQLPTLISKSKYHSEAKILHLKICAPIYYNQSLNKYYSKCVLSGSVNFTNNGLINNDEVLIVFRDQISIMKFIQIIHERSLQGKSISYEDIIKQIENRKYFPQKHNSY